jgi:hypothetical protein
MEKINELKCLTPNCEGKEFKTESIRPETFTVVNSKADVLYGSTLYTYRCLTCQKAFTSHLAPQNKKILHG